MHAHQTLNEHRSFGEGVYVCVRVRKMTTRGELEHTFGTSFIYSWPRRDSGSAVSWRLGGKSACDPKREIDFGFVFVHASCVRAKLCAMIPLWLGAAKLFSPAAAPLAGGRPATSHR